MNPEKFSFVELKRLIAVGPMRDLQDAKNYILKFFLSFNKWNGHVFERRC